jgi:hypothetical protein
MAGKKSTKTKTTKKSGVKNIGGNFDPAEAFRTELIQFRRVTRSALNFSEKLRRNKTRNPEKLRELVSAIGQHSNRVVQMFPNAWQGGTNPKVVSLMRKREQIERELARYEGTTPLKKVG